MFLPRPERPPIYIGGAAEYAVERIVRFGEGWMPMRTGPDKLKPQVEHLREQMQAAGKPAPEVAPMMSLALDDPSAAAAKLNDFSQAGATRIVHTWRYADAAEFMHAIDTLTTQVRPQLDGGST